MSHLITAINLLFSDRWKLIDVLTVKFSKFIGDEMYIKIRFRANMGYWPNLTHPQTFNEKLNWLKLYNRRDEYTQMVDKLLVKDYVEKIIGKEYIIPTISIWDSVADIDWETLPQQFVIKTTHGGGGTGVVICDDSRTFDKSQAIRRLVDSMSSDIYDSLREWPYKNVKKRIIAEQYITDPTGCLKDYKFFCFNGEVKCYKIDIDRFTGHKANYYDKSGNLLPFGELNFPPDFNHKEVMPDNLDEMITLAELLSKGHPFMRVDLYNINGRIYFGEITFFPAGGIGRFTDNEWDKRLGEYLIINT